MRSPTSGRRAVLRMTWRDLAFLHWRIAPERIAPLLPPGLELDCFDGAAWLGVVPFEMRGTRFTMAPPLPTATDFPELNLRTYVTCEGRPGVWFFSLDAASKLSVRGARATFALPYMDARMRMDRGGDGSQAPGIASGIEYVSERTHRGAPPARFRGTYRATGPVQYASDGSLEHFLTERYSLFAQKGFGVERSLRSGLVRGDIEHEPWPLRPGEADLDVCDMFRLVGLEEDDACVQVPPIVHVVDSVDVLAFAPRLVRRSR